MTYTLKRVPLRHRIGLSSTSKAINRTFMSPRGQIFCSFITYSYLCKIETNNNDKLQNLQPKDMTNSKFFKITFHHAIKQSSASGLYGQYPHPFLTPSLYSPHPLSKERWGYSKRGVRDRDIFLIGFHRKTS